jgi:TPR repeat protein
MPIARSDEQRRRAVAMHPSKPSNPRQPSFDREQLALEPSTPASRAAIAHARKMDEADFGELQLGQQQGDVTLDISDAVAHKLEHLFDDPQYADVVLAAPHGRDFHCHRAILVAWSGYFEQLFQDEETLAQQTEALATDRAAPAYGQPSTVYGPLNPMRVQLPYDGEGLERVLRFCYTGTIELGDASLRETVESVCEVVRVLAAARMYRVHELAHACEQWLIPLMVPDEMRRLVEHEIAAITGETTISVDRRGPPRLGEALVALQLAKITVARGGAETVGFLEPGDQIKVLELYPRREDKAWKRKLYVDWWVRCARGWVQGTAATVNGARVHGDDPTSHQRQAVLGPLRSAASSNGRPGEVLTTGLAPQLKPRAEVKRKRVQKTTELLQRLERAFDCANPSYSDVSVVMAEDPSAVEDAYVTSRGGASPIPTETVLCHRAILAAWSDSLRQDLAEALSRYQPHTQFCLSLPHFGYPRQMHRLLKFMYTGKLRMGRREAPNFLLLSMRYGIDRVARHCRKLLSQMGDDAITVRLVQQKLTEARTSHKKSARARRQLIEQHHARAENSALMGSLTLREPLVLTYTDLRNRKQPRVYSAKLPAGCHYANHFRATLEGLFSAKVAGGVRIDFRYEGGVASVRPSREGNLGPREALMALCAFQPSMHTHAILPGDQAPVLGQQPQPRGRSVRVGLDKAVLDANEVLASRGILPGMLIPQKVLSHVLTQVYGGVALHHELQRARAALGKHAELTDDNLRELLRNMLYFHYQRDALLEISRYCPDQRLSFTEFERACQSLGEVLDAEALAAQFEHLDTQHSEVVEFEAFCCWAVRHHFGDDSHHESARLLAMHMMPSASRRTDALRRAGVVDPKMPLSESKCQDAVALLFPAYNLVPEVQSAYRATCVAPSVLERERETPTERQRRLESWSSLHTSGTLPLGGSGAFVARGESMADVHGESLYHYAGAFQRQQRHHMAPLQQMLPSQFRTLLQRTLWFYDRWVKIQRVLEACQGTQMDFTGFLRAAVLLDREFRSAQVAQGEHGLQDEFDALDPMCRGTIHTHHFMSWLALRQPWEADAEDDDEFDATPMGAGRESLPLIARRHDELQSSLGRDTLSPRSHPSKDQRGAATPRYLGGHRLPEPAMYDIESVFVKYDPNEHGLLLPDVEEALLELFPRVARNHPAVDAAYRAADVDKDGWIQLREWRWLVEYFHYFYANWSKFDHLKAKYFHRKGSEHRITQVKEFAECCEILDIGLVEHEYNKMFWIAADDDPSHSGHKTWKRPAVWQDEHDAKRPGHAQTSITFGKFTMWVAQYMCRHLPPQQQVKKREDAHFSVTKSPVHADGSMIDSDHRLPVLQVPPKDKCDAVFLRTDAHGGGALGLSQLEEAVRSAFPVLSDHAVPVRTTQLVHALAASDADGVVGETHCGRVTLRDFPQFLEYFIFFFAHDHALQEVMRSHSGRMNLRSFTQACKELHIKLSAVEAQGIFQELVVHTHNADAIAHHAGETTRRQGVMRDIRHDATMLNRDGSLTVPHRDPYLHFDEFCVWACHRKCPPRRQELQQRRLPVPTLERCQELYTNHAHGAASSLSLTQVNKVVSELWPNIEPARALLMRAYKTASADGHGHIRATELHLLLQYIAYLDIAWESLEGLTLSPPRRLSLESMENACAVLGEWLSPEDVKAEFQALGGDAAGTIGFDAFCEWLLHRHADGEEIDPADDHPLSAGHESSSHFALSPRLSRNTATRGAPESDGSTEYFNISSSFRSDASGGGSRGMQRFRMEGVSAAEAKELFERWDSNDNGALSLAEIDKAVVEAYPEFNHKPVLMRAYKAADTSRDGLIGRREFPRLLKYLCFFNNVWHVFEAMDTSHDRRLTQSEFIRGCRQLGLRMRPEEAREAFHSMESHRGGLVLFDDFCTWFARRMHAHEPAHDDKRVLKYSHMAPKKCHELGTYYQRGEGVKKNLEEAAACFASAADRGYCPSQAALGMAYLNGEGVEKDSREAVTYLGAAAEQGDVDASCQLGICFMEGIGVSQDYTKAVEAFRLSAKWSAKAQFNLGLCYARGLGVDQDAVTAVHFYEKAAKQGLAEAQNNLGECCMTGTGTEHDTFKGFKYKKQAADQGLAEAQYNIGLCFLRGVMTGDGRGGHATGVGAGGVSRQQSSQKDLAQASAYLKLAAKQGHDKAVAELEQMEEHKRMQRVERKYERVKALFESGETDSDAVSLLRECADEGHTDAQHWLGTLYEDGAHGVAQSLTAARSLYKQAATQGHLDALNALGFILLEMGWKDGSLDTHWHDAVRSLTLAAERGHLEACYNLGEAWMARALSGTDLDAASELGQRAEADPDEPICTEAIGHAVYWFTKAADRGYGRAQFNLGALYHHGNRAVPKSYSRAVHYYQMAASHPHAASAKYELGWVLLQGRDTPYTAADHAQSAAAAATVAAEAPPAALPSSASLLVNHGFEQQRQIEHGNTSLQPPVHPVTGKLLSPGAQLPPPPPPLSQRPSLPDGRAISPARFPEAAQSHQPAPQPEPELFLEAAGRLTPSPTSRRRNAGQLHQSATGLPDAERARVLFEDAAALGHEDAELLLGSWEGVVRAVCGRQAPTLQRLAELPPPVEVVCRAYLLKAIDRDETMGRIHVLEQQLHTHEVETMRLRAATASNQQQLAHIQSVCSRLLLTVSTVHQVHLLHAAVEGHALSAELEWAHTSLDDVLALVRSRLRGQQSWASLAIWTRRQPATEEVQLVSGMGLTLERLEQDAAYRSFWQELGSLIQPDGHLMLLGLGDAASLEAVEEVPEERHRLFERLAKVTRRQLVLPHVLTAGVLAPEARADRYFTEYFDLDAAARWSRAAAQVEMELNQPVQAAEQRAAQARQQRDEAARAEAAAQQHHITATQREAQMDARVDMLQSRLEQRTERGAVLSVDSAAEQLLRQPCTYREVQMMMHEDGLENIALSVAVDFSSTNSWCGELCFGGRGLHETTCGVPTPYESALRALAETLLFFGGSGREDDASLVPAYGFGAPCVPDGAVFPLLAGEAPCRCEGGNPHALVQAYHQAAADCVAAMEGAPPTVPATSLVPPIYKAIERVAACRHSTPAEFEQLHVLVILTASDVPRAPDMHPTAWSAEEAALVRALQHASHLPLAVLVVGVGDGRAPHAPNSDRGRLLHDGHEAPPWEVLSRLAQGVPQTKFANLSFARFGPRHGAPHALRRFVAEAVAQLPTQWREASRLGIAAASEGPYASQGWTSSLLRQCTVATVPPLQAPAARTAVQRHEDALSDQSDELFTSVDSDGSGFVSSTAAALGPTDPFDGRSPWVGGACSRWKACLPESRCPAVAEWLMLTSSAVVCVCVCVRRR